MSGTKPEKGEHIKRMNRASPDTNLCKELLQDFSKLRENHDLFDLTVVIDGDIFPCHSFILVSHSEFFRCLLRTDMEEKHEKTVQLHEISSPIFQLILDSLYTGREFLTKENALEVWGAVHQLQIDLLIKHCELFIINNLSLEILDRVKAYADAFESNTVSKAIFEFILKNFEALKDKEIFFQLDFQYVKKIVESDMLIVRSEDVILFSIFNWVDYKAKKPANESKYAVSNTIQDIGNNETLEESNKNTSETNKDAAKEEHKTDSQNPMEPCTIKEFLIELLKCSRYYLASQKCICKLYKHKLAQNNIAINEMLLNSLFFNLSDHWNGHCPTCAINRNCSDLDHFGVSCYEGLIVALSLKENTWNFVPTEKTLNNSKLTICKGKLYACSTRRADNEIFVLNSNSWKQVAVVKQSVQLLLAHEQSIYLLDSTEKVFIQLNPDTLELEKITHNLQNPEFALSFQDKIIVFCSVDNNGLEETAVHSWNTETNEWKQLDNIQFSSKNMANFRDDIDTYILDCNGILLRIINNEVLSFTFVAKLWKDKYDVKGCVLFRKTLYILADSPMKDERLNEIEGVFSKLMFWLSDEKNSHFLHCVLSKSEVLQLYPS